MGFEQVEAGGTCKVMGEGLSMALDNVSYLPRVGFERIVTDGTCRLRGRCEV